MADQRGALAEARVIANPISGERIEIRQSGEQTEGRLLAFDLFLPPGGHVPAAHVHPMQQERFTVVSGRIQFRIGRRRVLAEAGETLLVEPGTAHWFGNAGQAGAVMRVEVRPALRMEALLVRSCELARAQRARRAHRPRLSDLAGLLLDFERELAVPNIPGRVLRWLLAACAWFAGRRPATSNRRA